MEEEIEYWRKLAAAPSRDSSALRNVEYVLKHLVEYLSKSLLDLQHSNPRDALEIVETVDLQLTELWKQKDTASKAFPEEHMRSLFAIFETAVVGVVRNSWRDVKMWTSGYREVEEHISDCLALCEKWIEVCRILTAEVWTEFSKNPWGSTPVVPAAVQKLKTRLNQILTVRGVVSDTLFLVGRMEKPGPLEAFSDVDGLDISSENDAKWDSAMRKFNVKMERYENTVVENLKTKFHDSDSASLQMLMEFRKCRSVIGRPNVKRALTAEREVLLGHLATITADYEDEYSRDNSEIFDNHSRVISNMIWTRQLIMKIRELDVGLEQALGDLPKFPALAEKLRQLKENAETRIQDKFDSWSSDVSKEVKNVNGELNLDVSGRLMDIEQPSGRLIVNFSDRLVTLIKEVRYMESIGFRVPEAVKERHDLAKKFYDSGIVLMQVAHFYNTIDQQMINSQKPMLIESAKRFEKVIRSVRGGKGTASSVSVTSNDVRWSDVKRVEAYVSEVHDATLALTQENRRLRSLHQKVITIVLQMADTNLVQKLAEWKRLLNEIHKIIASVAVESQRYPAENMTPWRLHIDNQIKKALDIQLRKCLLSLAESLPEVQADMVYRNQSLQYRPSIHEMRENFSLELQKLFDIPSTLKPVSEISEKRNFFRQVVSECHLEAALAQRNFESLLVQLKQLLDESQQYVVLGSVDVYALIEARVMDVQDWERELKSLKQRARATDQIPLQLKVENVTVNFGPLRTAIDGLIQDTQDALVNTLRKSVLTEVDAVSGFVTNANAVLSSQPTTTEELTALSGDFHRLIRESDQMKPRLSSIDEKNALLRSTTGRGVDKSESILRSWTGVLSMLEDHKSVMRDQTAVLQERIQKDIRSLESDVERFEARWLQARPSEDRLDELTVVQIKQLSETVKTKRDDLDVIVKRRNNLVAQCGLLDIPTPAGAVLDRIKADLDASDVTWKELLDFSQEVETLSQEDWLTFRNKLYRFEDFLKLWHTKMQSSNPTAFTLRIQKEISSYRSALPSLKACRGEAFSEEHWAELFAILQLKSAVSIEQLTLGHLIGSCDQLVKQSAAIKDLAARAQAEVSIREALRELEIWGAAAVFHLTSYSDAAGQQVQIVKEWSELLSMVGEKQRLLQSTKDSQHYGKFSDRIAIWEQRLVDLSFLLDNLHQVQRRWVYLEPIYSRNSLPNEEGRFKRTDGDFRGVLKEVTKEPRLIPWMRPALKSVLPGLLDQLQRCQKALNEFLEAKRLAFPRFYFIGDDDLLEILGQSGNPKVLQAHLKKLFAGVHSVEFSGDMRHIVAVKSPEGEQFTLKSPVALAGSVEVWLSALSEELKRTLRIRLRECLSEASGKDLSETYPSQVQRLAEHIRFTSAAEDGIRAKKLVQVQSDLQSRLDKLTSQQHGSAENLVRLTTLQGLILDTIHRLDMVQRLVEAKVTAVDDWLWQKQLRFYGEADASVTVRMVDAEFKYSFEYQGCLTGLVHTPLTDKCFLTLTQAMQMGLGGNPYGPAGTGKTESVKELGAHLGRQVLVFNCDEGIDSRSMGRIFVGLLKCGAWGCFDEFNRLDELTMSAISMQVLAIQAALKDSNQKLELLDRKIEINRDAGIFITLNPASKGYGGRQKLPDNLKQLFRPVAMTVPDAERIAEVMFLAEGFQHAKTMGRKLVVVYASARELLSRQQHYDWGLRATKSTIQMAGRFLAVKRSTGQSKTVLSEIEEAAVVVQAVRSNVLSKLTLDDQNRFLELLQDGFPRANQSQTENTQLGEAITAAFGQLGLTENKIQIQKAVELRDQLAQRIGVVIVGPAASGKTTVWQLLHAAMLSLNMPLKYHVINPTAMPKTQLLGSVDEATREWTDGVLTKCVREVLADAAETAAWIVCDGDIDPDWVESLNSVLDDNRLLTLPSGERLRFPANVNFLFETDNLKAASPATVSRMGMVFLSPRDVRLETVVEAWILKQPKERQSSLTDFAKDVLYKAVSRAVEWEGNDRKLSEVSVGNNVMSVLAGRTHRADMTASLVQSAGGSLPARLQDTYAAEILRSAGYDPPDSQRQFNVFYDSESENLKAVRVGQTMDASNVSALSFDRPPVYPCASQDLAVIRLKAWLLHAEHIFLSGSSGWGKSVTLSHAFLAADIRNVLTLRCTSLTSSRILIAKLSRACLSIPTAKGKIMRPKNTDRLIVLVEDVHVVKQDRWGHRQIEAFLRQVITQGGFFDETQEWVQLDGVQLVITADDDTGGSGGSVSDRLTSIMRTTYLAKPDTEDLLLIAGGYFRAVIALQCKGHSVWSKPQNIDKLAKTAVAVFSKCRERFSRERRSHYGLTLRDLTGCIMGLCRYNLQDQSGTLLLTALVYELNRAFFDKLASPSDRAQFEGIISESLKIDWSSTVVDQDVLFAASALQGSAAIIDGAPLPSLGRTLSKITAGEMKLMVSTAIRQINRDNSTLEAYLHDALLDSVMKVDHVLSQPGGSVLMLAPSGYGRRTIAFIAIKLQLAVLIKPRLVKGYNVKHFQADIKRVIDVVAVKNENAVLLLEDFQIVDAVFLEIVTSLLACGEYAGLFNEEEAEKMNNAVADQMAQESFDGTPALFLINRIRKNFHCIVTMDNADTRFSSLNDRIPSLARQFHIIWTENLPEATLLSIPQGITAAGSPTEDRPQSGPAESAQLANSLAFVHKSSPPALQSSARFYNFIRTYRSVKETLTSSIQKKTQRLQAGLDQLTKARNEVMKLKRTVTDQHKALTNKQEEAKNAMDDIRESMSGASTQKEEVTLLKADLEVERGKLVEREKAIAVELADVLPILENAKAAVNKIKNSDLSEIKSLRAPPAVIHNILEGVLKLFGNKDTSWSGMRAFLTAGAKEEIIHFNTDKVSREHLKLTQALVEKNKSSFEEETAKRASAAAAPLAAWVKACVKYAEVHEKIAPLAAEKRKLESTIDMHAMRVNNADQDIGRLSSRIDLLQARFQKLTEEAAVMKIELSRFTEKLEVAEGLVEKLESEYARWSSQLKESTLLSRSLETNALLSSGFIVYLAACSEDDRVAYMAQWTDKFKSGPFDLLSQLTTEAERLEWRAEGLSSDTLSTENAVILFHTKVPPLIVDPTGSVVEWLRKSLKNKNAEILDQEDTNFQSILEIAIRFGKSLIVEISDLIEPVLVPLLRGDLIKSGTRIQVEMGDKLVDYHPAFRLYLTTRNSSLTLHPQTAALLNIVSFTATRAGLANQLLSLVIECKLPEVERRRRELLQEQEALKIKLTELEDSLLTELANSQGNLLENNELRESLNRTKASSDVAERNLEESRKVKETLDKDQAVFVVLATKCCSVYFALQTFPRLNALYRFSLQTFVGIYRKAVENLAKDDHVKDQLQKFCAVAFYQVIHYVHAHVSRSIFKRDRMTCLLQFVKVIRPELIKDSEWSFLLAADKVSSKDAAVLVPSWLPPALAPRLATLYSVIPDIAATLQLEDQSVWNVFMTHPQCETVFPPSAKVTPFQQTLVVKTLRPDRLVSALSLFVAKSLKLADLATDTSLRAAWEESSAAVPILIVTSAGADPSVELVEVGGRGKNSVLQIAMGVDETERAVQALQEAAQAGSWLCLSNLHLVPAFFQRILKEMKIMKPAASFRLWLTTESAEGVPVLLLETALKIVYEAPPGVKQNIQRTIKESTEQMKTSVGSAPSVQRTLLVLFWFHAVMQERRNYVPRGWTKFYEFSTSDLRAAMHIISKYGRNSPAPLDGYIRGLLETVVYGGRVDTPSDLRILTSYVDSFFASTESDTKIFGRLPPNLRSVTDFLDQVQTLPETDQPDILGLPANIDGSHQRTESVRVVRDLLALQKGELLKGSAVGGEWIPDLDKLRDLSASIRKKLERSEISGSGSGPLETFFIQELGFAMDLARKIDGELSSVGQKSGDGLTGKTIDSARSLLAHETPESWLAGWNGSAVDPLSFLKNVERLAESCRNSLAVVRKSATGYRLSVDDVFHPDVIVGVLRHLSARVSGVALEKLVFFNEWSLDKLKTVTHTVSLTGIHIEGAIFDGSLLRECQYDSPTSTLAPTCYVAWVAQETAKQYKIGKDTVDLPVFRDSSRDHIAFYLTVPCEGDPSKWIRFTSAFILTV